MTCSLDSIAKGPPATITVVVNVKATAGQSVSDTVSVSTGSSDPNLANNTATVTTYVVVPTPTTTSLTSSANPATFGQSVAFKTTVAPTSGSGTPTGTVTFTDTTSGTIFGTATLTGGTVNLTLSLSVGSHTISAVYSGDPYFKPSSGTLTETINKAPTTLSAAPASKTTPQFSATLTRTDNGAPIAGQTIAFSTKNPMTGAQDAVCSATTGTNGTATCTGTIPTLDKMVDTSYTATYAGNANYLGSNATGTLS
jgi:hypothetical protein